MLTLRRAAAVLALALALLTSQNADAKRPYVLARDAAWGDNPIFAEARFCYYAYAHANTDPEAKYAWVLFLAGHNQYVDITNAAVLAVAPDGQEVCVVGMSDELQDNGEGAPDRYPAGSYIELRWTQVRQ